MTDLPVPSTYTPFLRRIFTNERHAELTEIRDLYHWVKQRQDACTETMLTIGQRVYDEFLPLPGDVETTVIYTMHDLLEQEPYIAPLPTPDFDRMDLKELVEWRTLLNQKRYFFTNQQALLDLLEHGLLATLFGSVQGLPQTESPTPFTVPLVYTISNPRQTIDNILQFLFRDQFRDTGLFANVALRLFCNLCVVSGRDPEDNRSKKPFRHPSDSTMPLDELVDTYLAFTPYHRIFKTPVPLKLNYQDRFNHMHIVGGTGAGKTTLLHNLILHDIQSDDPPSLVVIDPHSDLIKKLTHTDLDLGDRLIIIDPRDTKHPPALNIFAINKDRFDSYDEATQEQVTAGVIQTFHYLFSGLTSLSLTGKQDVFFRYVARLMLSMPDTMGRNATILDMLKLMHDPSQYQPAIAALPDIPRDFFERDFMSKTFEMTKEQIRYRLQAIIENPTMARLFTSTETKVDLFTELNSGAVILVDTAKDFLKENSSTFGRLFISLVLQAVLERAAIAEDKRKPTFLIVDEAASYFDRNIDDLLTDTRKYKCGCVFAHQYLDQATSSLRASLHANTGIKFASGLSAADARIMAAEMRTTPDFILEQPKLQFAGYISGVTSQAVAIPINPVTDQPQLSAAAFEELMVKNRQRVSIPPPIQGPEGPQSFVMPEGTESPQGPDEDISPEW